MALEVGYLWNCDNVTPIIWRGSATTIGGVATFYPTDNETLGGNAIFGLIEFSLATAQLNTASAIAVPIAAIKDISADKKTVTVNVINGLLAVAGSNTVTFVPDGTVVSLYLDGHQ